RGPICGSPAELFQPLLDIAGALANTLGVAAQGVVHLGQAATGVGAGAQRNRDLICLGCFVETLGGHQRRRQPQVTRRTSWSQLDDLVPEIDRPGVITLAVADLGLQREYR